MDEISIDDITLWSKPNLLYMVSLLDFVNSIL